MPPKKVSHKPLSFEMWKERLKLYAETGQFPAGNHKPVANKQPRAHALFEKVQQCRSKRSYAKLAGAPEPNCICTLHKDFTNTSTKTSLNPKPDLAAAELQDVPDAEWLEDIEYVSPKKRIQTVPNPVSSLEFKQMVKTGIANSIVQAERSALTPPPLDSLEQQLNRKTPESITPVEIIDQVEKRSDGNNLQVINFPSQNEIFSDVSLKRSTADEKTNFLQEYQTINLDVGINTPKFTEVENSANSRICLGVSDVNPSSPRRSIRNLSDSRKVSTETEQRFLRGWMTSFPPYEWKWVKDAILCPSSTYGLEVKAGQDLQDWYHPPSYNPVSQQKPSLANFFGKSIFIWMPLKRWGVVYHCVKCKEKMKGAGTCRTVRQVLDVDRYYVMVTENVRCPNKRCGWSPPGWHLDLMKQLPLEYSRKFPAVLTSMYAADYHVITMMRERTLGNSATQLRKQLHEQHKRRWSIMCIQYMSAMLRLINAPYIGNLQPELVPECAKMPTSQWFLAAYSMDVLSRLDDVQASITSTYGNVLKIDSTKQIVKKLSGEAAGSANWCTNVGNEIGQVLISVLTVEEGKGLKKMADGLISRYKAGKKDPPKLIYTDRDCCDPSPISKLFDNWCSVENPTQIRLDVFHWMRRLEAGIYTQAHPLHPIFMTKLSEAIFEINSDDLDNLRKAKLSELHKDGKNVSATAVDKFITRKEIQLHCRRKTRCTSDILSLVPKILDQYSGPEGHNALGQPLFDSEEITSIWNKQKRHVDCLQDPTGVSLYFEMSTIQKGGYKLPVYKCSRGTSSLESFHLHLNRFIPGTSASDLHFQLYLLEGLYRWNQDRHNAVHGLADKAYDMDLQKEANRLSMLVFQRKMFPEFQPAFYTGELIGITYLYDQSGETLLTDQNPDDPILKKYVESEENQDEGFEEINTSICENYQNHEDEQYEDNAVDREGIPGFGAVDKLSSFLVSLLKDKPDIALESNVAQKIVQLWSCLCAFDKRTITQCSRHQVNVSPPKRRKTISADIAQQRILGCKKKLPVHPAKCRLVKCILTKLVAIHECPDWAATNNKTIQDYRHIKELVNNNSIIQEQSSLILMETNKHLISQWYNEKNLTEGTEDLQKCASEIVTKTTSTRMPPARTLLDVQQQFSSNNQPEPQLNLLPQPQLNSLPQYQPNFTPQSQPNLIHHSQQNITLLPQPLIRHSQPNLIPHFQPNLMPISIPQSQSNLMPQSQPNIIPQSQPIRIPKLHLQSNLQIKPHHNVLVKPAYLSLPNYVHPSSVPSTYTPPTASSTYTPSYSTLMRWKQKEAKGETQKYRRRQGPPKCSKCGGDKTLETGHTGRNFCPNTMST